ncbi:hypothetical protein [Corynebacterium accolens]|uniref:hypothetical protein n=1 Tax=Corynebacterium accolens TaxID=38284 RepID=UPI002542E118|nr:hypothetical protein [Corynebacterium accolens]MDK4280382.1 hypothetical protein [Corynebacterium accolens]MDK4337940.1 hypothetical protein [Corynebacterium accolens]MDK8680177.1 hypothetical protein [Corynebacterium accolens]MDK8820550.1 hypothetical protein [Corynebacterium accolens]
MSTETARGLNLFHLLSTFYSVASPPAAKTVEKLEVTPVKESQRKRRRLEI